MAKKRIVKEPTPVEALKHEDRRVNIPTEELREFVRAEEEAPKTMLYPRDRSLDPQLVWKGKDEQDREDLAVPVVPIYIQEKIHPQALIENLRETAKAGDPEPELALFDDFNGIQDFKKKIDFYSHDLGAQPRWSNRLILGDSLLVMTSLAEKERLKGRVQMIYMDPPYGIRFGSNWQVSTRKRIVRDGKVEDATRQPEQVKAFRDTWALGIHSYLSYLRDRLAVAAELLTETGSFFLQIGDENVHLVRCLLDEVFGSENFVSLIAFTKAPGGLESAGQLSARLDYLIWYAKAIDRYKFRPLFSERDKTDESEWNIVVHPDGEISPLSSLDRSQPLPEGCERAASVLMTKPGPGSRYEVEFRGRVFDSGNRWWGLQESSMKTLLRSGRVGIFGNTIRFVKKASDFSEKAISNLWGGLVGAVDPIYVVQTNSTVIERCLLMTTDPGDLVLDPTCGAGTTSVAAERWARRWIAIDTSRVALALARTWLMAAKYPYYLLSDSPGGRQKEAEITGATAALASPARTNGDIKKGFVYKRVPHTTLKSIANNEEIDAIDARYTDKLLQVRSKLNRLLEKEWLEWDVPRKVNAMWPSSAKELHTEWWHLRQERQKQINEAISRRVDTEILFDRPYEDGTRIRVSGPFTVESLSPHRVLVIDEDQPTSEAEARQEAIGNQFETMVLDNLRKAGVQNTRRSERLVFSRLEPFAGGWLQGAGEFSDAAGRVRRVAVSIGPELGTVGRQQIQEAAKEAVRGIGFDLLLVLGFSFDAHASEVAAEISPVNLKPEDGFVAEFQEEYGRLPVLLVRMNPDLAMGDQLLKKTGAGNLFMVFGEPDVEIRKQQDGKLMVEIKGVDVYDPTTGVVRSSSTDDIACWFVDTNYNDESFFVRQAYFTGAGDPFEKLKRALRTEVSEVAWSTLYSTVSRPFDPPATGKIAVKVINHYGDEVLKVYRLTGGPLANEG